LVRLGLWLGLRLGLIVRVSSATAYFIYRYSLDGAICVHTANNTTDTQTTVWAMFCFTE